MYGINLLTVARVLGVAMAGNGLFSENGAIRAIHQEIIKYSARQDIDMVKVLMRNLALQNEQAYKDAAEVLRGHFTEQELQEILPG